MPKPVKKKAWACLWNIYKSAPVLAPIGNGQQFQYPIFHSRKEALSYKKSNYGVKEIIPVTISYSLPSPKKKSK